MTVAPGLQMHNPKSDRKGEVLLGEDWVSPDAIADHELRARKGRRLAGLKRSPLARKIVIFNMMALVILVAGVLFLNPFRDSLVSQREKALVTESRLSAEVLSAQLAATEGAGLVTGGGAALEQRLREIGIDPGVTAFVFDAYGGKVGEVAAPPNPQGDVGGQTVISDFLNVVWSAVAGVMGSGVTAPAAADNETLVRELYADALAGKTPSRLVSAATGSVFAVATPVRQNGEVMGVVGLASAQGDIDRLVAAEREQILQMFVIALLVSVGLSLVLASTIANPLSDLAAAAELGRDRDARKMAPGRVRIPDLTARPDEIGRLSVAMRGMVAALYDRIDANEQFAADVAHEIKNPLASLRSAVGSLRFVKKEDHREKLLDVIEHDVRRLDRLVSDISNASRLDSELVKEEEEEFNLLKTLANLGEYLGQQASEKGVEFITDLPKEPIFIRGLEARLAQVFVNLITNAISFCETGDAVRVWVRKRENRVLVVVEDTGPGIPDQALTKVFKRFYSERPEGQFGNHSGLGLAISKQIVEAHGGVIWAENIRPTNADITSEPLGARFVVGLPV